MAQSATSHPSDHADIDANCAPNDATASTMTPQVETGSSGASVPSTTATILGLAAVAAVHYLANRLSSSTGDDAGAADHVNRLVTTFGDVTRNSHAFDKSIKFFKW